MPFCVRCELRDGPVLDSVAMRFPQTCWLSLACIAAALSCACTSEQKLRAQSENSAHPLDPLNAEEISNVAGALERAGRLGGAVRVVTIELDEPEKPAVIGRTRSAPPPRVARAVLYDWGRGTTDEMTVDVRSGALTPARTVSTGDPPVRRMVIQRATEIALADDRVVNALRRHGVTADRVTFLGGLAEGRPLNRQNSGAIPVTVNAWAWDRLGDASVLSGLSVTVDLAGGTVTRVADSGGASSVDNARGTLTGIPLKPLNVSMPEGPSFRLDGNRIEWDRWRLHFDVHPRRGLELYDVSLADGTERRSVLYRASLSELITPYGDPSFSSWYPRDEGDYGLTAYSAARANAIIGVDAPVYATFASAVFADDHGKPLRLERAVAIYERDGGVLWRHAGEGRRARQLVLSGYATIDNYDYLMNWIFSQDGAIDVQVQLTGVMNIRHGSDEVHSGDGAHFAHLVAPQVMAPNHQHFFCWRLDFDVDGSTNRIVEWNTANTQGEWFAMNEQTLSTETAARREVNASTARRWVVVNESHRNRMGQPSAYALLPGENASPFPAPGTAPRKRAAFLDHHLWATLFDPHQIYASGEWVNLMREGEGVASWSAANRNIVDHDVVLWYTFAVTHLPRPEDWPVMPTYTAGFRLAPVGFFSENPVLSP